MLHNLSQEEGYFDDGPTIKDVTGPNIAMDFNKDCRSVSVRTVYSNDEFDNGLVKQQYTIPSQGQEAEIMDAEFEEAAPGIESEPTFTDEQLADPNFAPHISPKTHYIWWDEKDRLWHCAPKETPSPVMPLIDQEKAKVLLEEVFGPKQEAAIFKTTSKNLPAIGETGPARVSVQPSCERGCNKP